MSNQYGKPCIIQILTVSISIRLKRTLAQMPLFFQLKIGRKS